MTRTAVVVALHRPDAERLRRLLDSVVQQRGASPRLVVAGAARDLEAPAVAAVLARTGALCLQRQDGDTIAQRFAAGLAAALAEAACTTFAFCDQDDLWHAHKLSRCLAGLQGGAGLVHCDARVVTADGRLLAPSLHRLERRRDGGCQADFLLRNSVSGFTALFTRTVAERVVTLMPEIGAGMLHDQLAAVAAGSCGGVVFLAETLADYVQHSGNVVGAMAPAPLAGRWLLDLPGFRARSRAWFAELAAVAQALARHGWAEPGLAALFGLAGRPPSAAAWLRLALRQARRGDGRRLRDALRLLDGAWQQGRKGNRILAERE